ncbi:MAG: hypothetical protein K2Q32_07420 [Alphaproteobacteria bacterium]|nr:hypothetical protein [Alphaproteobacteria bacterium]
MFGIGKRRKPAALDELKERMTLPDIKRAETVVLDFYQGRNPYEHLKGEWPEPYEEFMRGFAYALDRCKREGIVDFDRCEVIASGCGVTLARSAVATNNEQRVSHGR